jgi:hypothetical protein
VYGPQQQCPLLFLGESLEAPWQEAELLGDNRFKKDHTVLLLKDKVCILASYLLL